MTDQSPEAQDVRRRWINLGEFVAVAGLIISGLALWNSWGDEKPERPAATVERPRAIPIALRGMIEDDGKSIALSPAEPIHSLDSASLTANGKEIAIGSNGSLSAESVQSLVGKPARGAKAGTLPVTIKARYVEAGEDKVGTGRYRIAYRWTDGGLFGGHDLRLSGFSRG